MNRKQRLAVIFLVVAIVMLLFSFAIESTLSSARESYDGNENFGGTNANSVGKISLEIVPYTERGENGAG
ncbi:MAG: hypothetical protein IH845_03230 [Nanoarchaeota archaeon]|nr:hypothetical protein [Nanoarchaeota archaeon]